MLQRASGLVELELGNGWLLDLCEDQPGQLTRVGVTSPTLESQTVLDSPVDSRLMGPHDQALREAGESCTLVT